MPVNCSKAAAITAGVGSLLGGAAIATAMLTSSGSDNDKEEKVMKEEKFEDVSQKNRRAKPNHLVVFTLFIPFVVFTFFIPFK